jgi:hypoxanthine phosphoribosyltransferase
MDKVRLLGKEFALYLPAGKIQIQVQRLADKMNDELKDEEVIFVGVLNGAFMFASDLLRRISFNVYVTFVKLSSYPEITSSGTVKSLIGLNDDFRDKTVVVIEDIVETGNTIEAIAKEITVFKPAKILFAALLLKPDQYKKDIDLQYIGFRIPGNFIIGYGLDYQGYGRNLKDLYQMVE